MQERRPNNTFSLFHFFLSVLFPLLPPILHCLYPCFTSSSEVFLPPCFLHYLLCSISSCKVYHYIKLLSLLSFPVSIRIPDPFTGILSRSWPQVASDDDDPAERELWTAESCSWSKHGTCSKMNFSEREVWYKWETLDEIVEICFTSIIAFFSLNAKVNSIYCTEGFSNCTGETHTLHCVQRTCSKIKISIII